VCILARISLFDNSGNIWVNDMVTKEHFKRLQAGRKKYQTERTKARLEHENSLFSDGVKEVGKLSKRELFLVGVALYWAEGFKHKSESALGLATMDVNMAIIYIRWLKECLGIENDRLRLRVTANIHYSEKIRVMEKFWSDSLGVGLDQFVKPFFQKTIQKKVYANSNRYFGVIRIRAIKSLDFLRKMRGWTVGLGSDEAE
jgi:hypothetical protein